MESYVKLFSQCLVSNDALSVLALCSSLCSLERKGSPSLCSLSFTPHEHLFFLVHIALDQEGIWATCLGCLSSGWGRRGSGRSDGERGFLSSLLLDCPLSPSPHPQASALATGPSQVFALVVFVSGSL